MKRITVTLLLAGLVTAELQAQVGIGTANPKARLHVADSSVVFSASENWSSNIGTPPISGPGRRMMWYPNKAAFRSGYVSGSQWDNINIGIFSTAMGESTMASGRGAVAMGAAETKATGMGAVAMGSRAIASGNWSTALGTNATASGDLSVALGDAPLAAGHSSLAMGFFSKAFGSYATAIGYSTTANGSFSVAMGNNTIAPGPYEMAIGVYNTNYVPSQDSARLFVIGNGDGLAGPIRRDALTVLKNGHVGIGFGIGSSAISGYTLSVNGTAAKPGSSTWAITSDVRTKRNIKKYSAGLKEILAIDPVRFQYNHLSGYADTTRQYVGVLAQEIEKILPSTVSIVTNDPLVKDKRVYDGNELVYTLINAIKELSARISVLEASQQERTTLVTLTKNGHKRPGKK